MMSGQDRRGCMQQHPLCLFLGSIGILLRHLVVIDEVCGGKITTNRSVDTAV